MSKIIDELQETSSTLTVARRKSRGDFVPYQQNKDLSSPLRAPSHVSLSAADLRKRTNERISDVFFSAKKAGTAAETITLPSLDSTIHSLPDGHRLNLTLLLSVVTVFVLFIVTLFALDKIRIDIKISKRSAAQGTALTAVPNAASVPVVASVDPSVIDLKDDTGITVSFNGAGRDLSKVFKDHAVLVNGEARSWANMLIVFPQPLNLNDNDMTFWIRGKRGDERFVMVLSDSMGRSYTREQPVSPSENWQKVVCPLDQAVEQLDTANIVSLRLEYGVLNVGNYPGAVLYLKDLGVAKK